MVVTPLIAGIGALGGYVIYDKLKDGRAAAGQPADDPKQPYGTDWFNLGTRPQTGNGAPKTDTGAIANTIGDVAQFGTSLVQFFGTAASSGSGGSGGIGANTTQTSSYGSGAPLGDNDGNFGGSDPSEWSMPSFD